MARRVGATGAYQPAGMFPQVYIPGLGGTPAAMVPQRRPSAGGRRANADSGALGSSLMVQSVMLRRSIDRFGGGAAPPPAASGAVEQAAFKTLVANPVYRLDAPRSPHRDQTRGPGPTAKSAWPAASVHDVLHVNHKDVRRLQYADPRVHGMAGRSLDTSAIVGDAQVLLADVIRVRQEQQQQGRGWVQPAARAGLPANPPEAGRRLGQRSSVAGHAVGPSRANNTSRDYPQARVQGPAPHMAGAHYLYDTHRVCGTEQMQLLLGSAQAHGFGANGAAAPVMVVSLRNQLLNAQSATTQPPPQRDALNNGRVSNRRTLPVRPASGQPLRRSSCGAGGGGAGGPLHVWSTCTSPQAISSGPASHGALPTTSSPSRAPTLPTDKEGPSGGVAPGGESSDASAANTDEASGSNTPDHQTPHADSSGKPGTADTAAKREATEGEADGATVRGTHDAGTTSPSVADKGRGAGWLTALSRLTNRCERTKNCGQGICYPTTLRVSLCVRACACARMCARTRRLRT